MRLHVGGEIELVSWILSFGASAYVVSPERLRQRVESELARTLERYSREVTVAPPSSAKKPAKLAARKAAARR
jgi:hypothetical protein